MSDIFKSVLSILLIVFGLIGIESSIQDWFNVFDSGTNSVPYLIISTFAVVVGLAGVRSVYS